MLILLGLQIYASNDKYRLSLRDNPDTSIVIGWDQISGSNPTVFYGTTDFGTNTANYPNSATPSRTVDYKGMNNNFVRLTKLKPNTAYYFVIKDSEGVSERFWFMTAPSDNSRLSFIAGGDSRNNHIPRKSANLLVSKLKPHAVLFGGDMTNGDTDTEWKEWFKDWQLTIASDNRMFPIVAARGNHEDSNLSIYHLFDVPSPSVYYAINFGGNLARMYTLNTEISIYGSQTDWLEEDLDKNKNVIWKMAQYHKPMRPHVFFKFNGNHQYYNWAQLFYEKGVRLVIECDAHTVKTTWPIKPSTESGSDQGFIREDKNGTVYTGEGCWGAPLRSNNSNKDWTRNSGMFNQFKWIFVDEHKIEIRTIKVNNAYEVEEVSNIDIFKTPKNLDIWNPSNGSVVTIYKGGIANPDPNVKSISIPIIDGNDDVEEDKYGDLYTNSSDLELVYDTYNYSSYQVIGLRFQSVKIPEKATILDAHIQFTSYESNSENATFEIALHDELNSPEFTNANNVSGRSTFSNKILWKPKPWVENQNSDPQRSPNLKKIIQELVDQKDWASGNNLSFSISGKDESLKNKSAKRIAYSYDKKSTKAAILSITYKTINKLNSYEITNNHPIEEHNFKIYPNPFSNEINIISLTENSCKNTAMIYNVQGKILHKQTILSNGIIGSKTTLMPEIKAKGIYLLSIKDQKGKTLFLKQIIKN